jgi:hypothetical protein
MRTLVPMMIVLALAVAGMMLTGGAFASEWGAQPPSTEQAQAGLNDSAGDVNPQSGPIEGPVAQTDGSIIGLIGSGLGTITKIGGAVATLPLTLVNLGFPAWFAYPLGLIGQLLVGIGIIEFAINREWT